MKTPPHEYRKRPWFPLLSAGILLHSLTYCSGTTSTGGGSGGSGGTGGFGFAGHTADCINGNCHPGCACSYAGSGGTPNGGAPGGTPNGGTSDDGGTTQAGYAGHTAGCLAGNCQGHCIGFPGCGGSPSGGMSGFGGTLDGLGGAGDGGQDMGGAPDGGQAAARTRAAKRTSPTSEQRACYALTGYEADPCLPADDSLLAWLNAPNLDCPLTVTSGPSLMGGPIGRACCYSVSCAQPSE